MLETIRRYSNRITFLLLALCGVALLLYSTFHHAPTRGVRKSNGLPMMRPPSTAYRSYLHGLLAPNATITEQDFRRSIREDGKNPITWLALAELLRRQNRLKEALADYRMAFKPHPDWDAEWLSYWHKSGQIDPEAALRYAQLCDTPGNGKEAAVAYAGVNSAVEYKHLRALKGFDWKVVSSPKKSAYLAIAYWRDNQKRHTEALAAYALAGVRPVK